MNEIGGYIEFEHYTRETLHENAVALNSGRSCLAYILRAKGIKRIVLPYFLCDSVRNICKKEDVMVRNYYIDKSFMPVDVQLKNDEWLYLVNYYGQLSGTQIQNLSEKYERLIVDNAQAYFDLPVSGVDTLYTCRKFFGVSDGAFLYTDNLIDEALPQDESFERMHFLLGRFERTASEFYPEYTANNKIFADEPIKNMSKLTMNLLRGIDYEYVKKIRTNNFNYLAGVLGKFNQLVLRPVEGAYAYPLLLSNGSEVRKKLLNYKIYIPILWPNVLEDVSLDKLEYNLALNILPLPCDHRYGKKEMQFICDKILKMGENNED